MIKLHQFPRFFGLPNASPFCVKVECWLRMTGIEYENVWVTDPSKMPKGKAPVIEHDGVMVPDSSFILDYIEKHFETHLDDHLDQRDRAAAHAFMRMLEERTYWVLVHSRWIDERGWPTTRKAFFGDIPPVIRDAIAFVMRRRVRGQLRGHGIGLHSEDEIYALGAKDLSALSDWLANRPFFMGEQPSSVDAVAYGVLANALYSIDNPLAEVARAHVNLAPYCERMRARYFPELEAK